MCLVQMMAKRPYASPTRPAYGIHNSAPMPMIFAVNAILYEGSTDDDLWTEGDVNNPAPY